MNPHVFAGALLFACAAIAGIVAASAICARVKGYDDGPRTGSPPIVALVAGAALMGAIAAAHGGPHADMGRLGLVALVTGAFVGAWYCDVARGVVPDVFSLGPLGIIAVLSFVWHDPRMLISAVVVFVPFALAAYLSRGRGMGWGDVKLAAVAGAMLGASYALLALALAAFAAAVGARLQRRMPETVPPSAPAVAAHPVAFAPYLIGATALFTAFAAL
ncbi:MAG TPA: A24 family peptidase [Candidatus Elarobacter sp.]|jgi:prepilin signal peptidase PulO-like enzyme (type II secretory pathway)|nr:A24 family peptidase [Candidatus Elarobacter sp.]